MAIGFPTTLDTLTNPESTDQQNDPSHSTQHANANDIVEALETKVGVDSSAVATSLDYLLKNSSSNDPGHTHTYATSDEWVDDSDIWVYVSAVSFKISAKDVSSEFRVGTKVKYVNSTTKYGTVISSAFVTDTTVTLATNDDYALADAAISSPQISYSNPPDFPQWFSWTPSIDAATPPVVGNGTAYGRFSIQGKTCVATAWFIFGSTSSYGAGTWTPLLPVSAEGAGTGNYRYSTQVLAFDENANTSYIGSGRVLPSTQPTVISGIWSDATAVTEAWDVDSPFTWTTSDELYWSLTYEID